MSAEPDEPYKTTATTCPRCAVGCSLRYDERSGHATGVEGAPVNREGRLCPKGIEAFCGLRENRLTQPLARSGGDTTGDHETGELVPVTWDEAYDRIAAGLCEIIEEYGPDALCFLGAPRCTNEENYLLAKLARALGTNNVDNRARSCHVATESVMSDRFGSGGMTNSLADVAEADAFLVIGANPATQQPIAFDSYVRPAVNAGATLIHVDPRANRTTRLADVHLAPRPGADALVICALLAAVFEADLIDRSFVAARTTGFEALSAELRDTDIDALCARAGVDPDLVRKAGRAFGTAERGAAIVGTGIEAGDHGRAAPDALANLLLCTGNIGKRGTGYNLFRGLVNEQGANDVGCRPTTLPGYAPVTDAAARARVGEQWGFEVPATPGRSELACVEAFGESIHGAFVLGENPAVSKRDDEFMSAKFESLSFLCVQDVFPTETTAYADVVVPASAWAEKSGTVTNVDRQVQRVRRLAPPPGNARTDREILCDLGTRLTNVRFEYESAEVVFEELTRVNPLYAGMTYAGIERGGQRWPFSRDVARGTTVLHRDRFANGAKRAPLTSVEGTLAEGERDGENADQRLVVLTRTRVNESVPGPDESGSGRDGVVELHPDDARDRDIEDGERVVIETGTERIVRGVSLTDDVRRQTIFIDGAVTRLASGTRVRVRPVRRPVPNAEQNGE